MHKGTEENEKIDNFITQRAKSLFLEQEHLCAENLHKGISDLETKQVEMV